MPLPEKIQTPVSIEKLIKAKNGQKDTSGESARKIANLRSEIERKKEEESDRPEKESVERKIESLYSFKDAMQRFRGNEKQFLTGEFKTLNPEQKRKILFLALERDDVHIASVFSYASDFLVNPDNENLLKKIAEKHPTTIVYNYDSFTKSPRFTEIMELALYGIATQEDDGMEGFLLRVKKYQTSSSLYDQIEKFLPKVMERYHKNIKLGKVLLAHDLKPRITDLLKDPSLRYFSDIYDLLPSIYRSPELKKEGVRIAAKIARNLFAQHLDVANSTVLSELKHLRKLQKEASDIPVFNDRNILMVTANEKLGFWNKMRSGNTHRFDTDATIKAVERQQSKNSTKDLLVFMKLRAHEETAEQSKKQILHAVENMPENLTMYFRGHGLEDGLWITEKERISPKELAEAFIARGKRLDLRATDELRKKDILIIEGCLSQGFTRTFYNLLEGKAPKPIVTGMSEYGQVGYGEPWKKHGNDFTSNVLNIESDRTTLGTIMEHEWEGTTKPYIFIPNDADVPFQITDLEQKNATTST